MSQENLNYATYHDGMNLNFGQCVDGSFFSTSFEHSLCFWLASFQTYSTIYGTFTIGQKEKEDNGGECKCENTHRRERPQDDNNKSFKACFYKLKVHNGKSLARDFGLVLWWDDDYDDEERKKTSFRGPAM